MTTDTAIVQRFVVLSAIFGLSAWAMDMAATQVALPTMQSALNISTTESQWILSLALMILAALVTLGGALGDRLGRLRVFRTGTLIFGAGAALVLGAGLADSFDVLMIGRIIEGVGVSLMMPASTGLIVDVFAPQERGGAQGQVFAISMLVTTVGPIVVGIIIQVLAWPWVYMLPLIFSVLTFYALSRLPKMAHAVPQTPFDYVGAVLLFLTVVTLTLGFMQAGSRGLTAPEVASSLTTGSIFAVILFVFELRRQSPLVQFRLLKIRNVGIGIFVSFMRVLPNVLASTFLARYVQEVLELSPTVTGLVIIPMTLAQFFLAGIAGKMLDQRGVRVPVQTGAALMAVGSGVLAIGYGAQDLLTLILGTVSVGGGFAFINPVSIAALNDTPTEQRGMLAGIFPLAGQFGTSIWVAIITALLVALSRQYTELGAADAAIAQAQALNTIGWMVAVASVLMFLATLLLRNPAPDAQS